MTPPPPQTIDEVQDWVRAHRSLLAHGGKTKPALSTPSPRAADPTVKLDLTALAGIVDYQPAEFVVTARAGTRLAALRAVLAQHHQDLPFDPPLVDAGATLGGTVAAGLSGSGRFRYGGLRDFLLGVRLVDGQGRLLVGGAKVVKNAAGFDLPKLMIGSFGRLGVLVELTFKVFPAPRARQTLRVDYPDLRAALADLDRLSRKDWGLAALDLVPPHSLWLQLAGPAAALDALGQRLAQNLAGDPEFVPAAAAAVHWQAVQELRDPAHPPGLLPPTLIKIPSTPKQIPELEAVANAAGATRRYCVAGNLTWLGWPADRPLVELDAYLAARGQRGLVLNRVGEGCLLGRAPDQALTRRLQPVLDPTQRFPPLPSGTRPE